MSRPVKELVLVTLLMILGMAACGSLFTILSEVVGGRSEKLVYLSIVCGVSAFGAVVVYFLRRKFIERRDAEDKLADAQRAPLAPGQMRVYRFDLNIEIVEQGTCDRLEALRLFEECCARSTAPYESFEQGNAATSFGLSRSDEDFIEVHCHSKDMVSVWSDRLHPSPRPWWRGGLGSHFDIKVDMRRGAEVVSDYFTLGRQSFEAKYAEHLCR